MGVSTRFFMLLSCVLRGCRVFPTSGSAQISNSTALKVVRDTSNAIISAMFNDGEILGKQS